MKRAGLNVIGSGKLTGSSMDPIGMPRMNVPRGIK